MGRPPLAVALFLVAGLLSACAPDVPGRGCKSDDECFTQELCHEGTCQARPRAVAEVDAGPDAEAPDAGVDAVALDALVVDAAPSAPSADAVRPADAVP